MKNSMPPAIVIGIASLISGSLFSALVQAAPASPAPCTYLLSAAPLGDGAPSTPESAIAAAWAQLIREAGVAALLRQGSVEQLLATPSGLAAEFLEGFELLRTQARLLEETGAISEAKLETAILIEFEALETESLQRAETARNAARRQSRSAIHSVPVGAKVLTPPLELEGGALVIGTEAGLRLISPEGRVLKIFAENQEIRENPILLNDGSLLAATRSGAVHLLSPALTEIARYGPMIEPGQPAPRVMMAIAQNGRIAVSEEHRITLLDRQGLQPLQTLLAYGPLYAPPLQLANGNWVAGGISEDNKGFIEFLSPTGARLALHTNVGRIASSGIELPDGKVVFGSGDRLARFFSEEGDLLGAVETNGSIYSKPQVLPDGTIAVGHIAGIALIANAPGARNPLRKSPGHDWSKGQPLFLPNFGTFLLTGTGDTLKFWNLDTNEAGVFFKTPNDVLASTPTLLSDHETVAVGDRSGNLHFLSIPALMDGKSP